MSALDRPATPTMLRQLAQAGALGGAELEAGLRLIDGRADRAAWRGFADKLLLGTGIGLIVTGVIFFFAANWDAVSQSARIGLALGAHVVAVVAAAVLGLRRPAGRAAAAGAALLIGPALLTYGQAYQTGADAWELFAGWAVLAVPFALVVRGTLLWAVVLGLARGAAFLYLTGRGEARESALLVALGCLTVDTMAVALAWLRAPAGRASLVFLLLGLSTLGPFLGASVAGEMRVAFAIQAPFVLCAIAVHIVGLWRTVVAGRTPDAALLGLSAAFHLGLFVARVVFEELNLDEGGMFLFGVFVLGEATALAALLGAAWKQGRRLGAVSSHVGGVSP
ncbi:MAG: DUF2157 domain-containing protein [Deltaproteobacteria bacterium]|nr:DUF2157 domain-containing protein [Deltaproteobacteria bacterium]